MLTKKIPLSVYFRVRNAVPVTGYMSPYEWEKSRKRRKPILLKDIEEGPGLVLNTINLGRHERWQSLYYSVRSKTLIMSLFQISIPRIYNL